MAIFMVQYRPLFYFNSRHDHQRFVGWPLGTHSCHLECITKMGGVVTLPKTLITAPERSCETTKLTVNVLTILGKLLCSFPQQLFIPTALIHP
jgi:hypothetical protein